MKKQTTIWSCHKPTLNLFCRLTHDVGPNKTPNSVLQWDVEAFLFNLRKTLVAENSLIDGSIQVAAVEKEKPQGG